MGTPACHVKSCAPSHRRGRRTAVGMCGRRTALMAAVRNGHMHVMELLIAAGADLAAKDNDG
jgi:hypothetical protein